jgi:dTDP-glucose 4,6-dehydratase
MMLIDMSEKTWMILGGGGSFAIQLAHYLLDSANPSRVIGVGRSPLRLEPFSLGIDRRDGYKYRALHVGHEFDLLVEYLDQEQPDIIVNFAAQGEGAVSWRHSWRFFDTNATALVRLTETLIERDWLERFVQISTSELYGSVQHPAIEDNEIQPTSPYAVSKAAFDMYLMAVASHSYIKFPMTILRPSNAYCPGQLLHRLIPRAVVCGLVGERLPLHGGGKVEKSYIHARDLARAIHLVCEGGSATLGNVYNVGPPGTTSIRGVVERCAEALGISFDDLIEVTTGRISEDACYWLDSSAIWSDVGWHPTIGWDEGLGEMVEWGKRYIDVLCDWPRGYQLRA